MAIQPPAMPGYRLYEYQLVIGANEELANRIIRLKKAFAEAYDTPFAGRMKPYIALAGFVTWSMMEERLRNRFRQIAMGYHPFKIELKGFGSYPSHTIYINVATKIPVQELGKQLRSAQRLMKAHPDHSPHFFSDPHITIARKLKPRQYEKGWLEYSHSHFAAKLIADGMLLLKRPLNEKTSWQIVERFDFKNLPVSTVQGELMF